ncbi:hypothetical protein KAM333_10700 [Aeromonas caviae]|nr:hypothetical protein C2U47_10620 [Aeromonas sp. ASNIH7]KMY38828.1 hypothetical protein ACH48_07210 [Aeromonas caviae]RDD49233.1 hypothetical protein ASJ36_15140 [Aeromonas sp. ARM81]PNO59949.1 hypothetical protein MC65_017200 [Aeromonas caviae]GJA05642.1 hypothetical protein KAM333_10700 [Aeromonas caviae]
MMGRSEWGMLQDLGYAQTDMVPFGRKPDEHKVDGVLYGEFPDTGGVFVNVVLTNRVPAAAMTLRQN